MKQLRTAALALCVGLGPLPVAAQQGERPDHHDGRRGPGRSGHGRDDDRHDRGAAQRGGDHRAGAHQAEEHGSHDGPPDRGRAAEREGQHRAASGDAHSSRARAHGRRTLDDHAVVTSFAPRAGRPGTEVTIRGRRFEPSVGLVVGGQPVRPSNVTPTAITFVVPPRSEGGPIQLRMPNRPPVVVGSFEVAQHPVERQRAHATRAALRAEAQRRWEARRAELAESEAARVAALREREQELQRTRENRRRERVAALQAQLQRELLDQDSVKDELALHGNRTAQIERMRRLADAAMNEDLAVRIGVLAQREEQRHEQRMNDLRAAFAASRQ